MKKSCMIWGLLPAISLLACGGPLPEDAADAPALQGASLSGALPYRGVSLASAELAIDPLGNGPLPGKHGADYVYPDPHYVAGYDSADYSVSKGMTTFRLPLVQTSGGVTTIFKVTDVVRNMLLYAGFPASQIDIPDAPVTFAPSGTDSNESLMINPGQDVLSIVLRALKDYLGWALVWDGNANFGGTKSMWRVIKPKKSPYTNLWNFQTDGPTGAGKLPFRPESYGTPNWVGTNGNTYIKKGTYRTYVKAPEANCVLVTATGDILPGNTGAFRVSNWAWNPKSYDFWSDNTGVTFPSADPTDPDYIGRLVPLIVVDMCLGAASIDGDNGQHAVDILTRRYYDVTCHARKICHFEAPLVLITDTADTLQTNPRPLRYYDPVTVTQIVAGTPVVTQYLVRNVNIVYKKDAIQHALYELEQPRI